MGTLGSGEVDPRTRILSKEGASPAALHPLRISDASFAAMATAIDAESPPGRVPLDGDIVYRRDRLLQSLKCIGTGDVLLIVRLES